MSVDLIETGSMKKRASPYMVGFVFTCIVVIIALLYIDQKATVAADKLYSTQSGSFFD
jgi:hypothetical protein